MVKAIVLIDVPVCLHNCGHFVMKRDAQPLKDMEFVTLKMNAETHVGIRCKRPGIIVSFWS
jgi:hypothetical protein